MLQDNINVMGIIDFEVYDANENLVDKIELHNTLVNGGKELLAKHMFGAATSGLSELWYWEIGSGSSATYGSMTALKAPNDTGKLDMSTTRTRSSSTDMFDYAAGSGVMNGIWGELGVYTKDNVLFSRSVIPDYEKTSGFVFRGVYRHIY